MFNQKFVVRAVESLVISSIGKRMAKVYVSVGSNVGDREKALIQAVHFLKQDAGEVTAVSSIYETEPWGFEAELYFLNIVIELITELQAPELLVKLLEIERKMGRIRAESGYQSRSIDLDILLYGNESISDSGLIVPHPRMQDRYFVLKPLAEVNSAAFHPVLGMDAGQMLDSCNDRSGITKLMDREVTENLLGVRKG